MIIPCKKLMNFHYWLMTEARKYQGTREESDHDLLSRLLYSGQQSIPAIPGACVKNNEEYRPVLVINDTELDYLNIIHTYLDAAKQANKEGLSIYDWIWKHGFNSINFYEPIESPSFSRGEWPVPVSVVAQIHRIDIDYQERELVFNLNLGKS
ncbi:hypothetical protein VPH219E481_0081 [Vibrio phage 219E48-1]|nr:hypothetical protein PODOV021v1_p0068 [Vibrio phage 219E41.2]QZI91066.1 hypothetical protein PODOV032v1_p0061 [Vibrio phage 219E41.1]